MHRMILAVALVTLACSDATDDQRAADDIESRELDDGETAFASSADGVDETAPEEPDAEPELAFEVDEPDDFAGDDPTAAEEPYVEAADPETGVTLSDEGLAALDTELEALAAAKRPGRPRIGISDSDPDTFSRDVAAWEGLRVRSARVFIHWDVPLRGAGDRWRQDFEAYVAHAHATHTELLVMFASCNASSAQSAAAHFDPVRNPKALFCRADANREITPTAREYDVAFKAFRRQWPHIRLIGAWNEPNFSGGNPVTPSGTKLYNPRCGNRRGDACGPTLAAHYYKIADKRCLQKKPNGTFRRLCRVIAGEFTSAPNAHEYWNAYRRGLRGVRFAPRIWGIHPTHDVQRLEFHRRDCSVANARGCTTRTFARWLDGLGGRWDNALLWLTETAPDYRDSRFRQQTATDIAALTDPEVRRRRERRQARGTRFALFKLPDVSARVTRVYLYNFQQDCTVENGQGTRPNDSGLLAPGCQGTPGADRKRPAYRVVRDR